MPQVDIVEFLQRNKGERFTVAQLEKKLKFCRSGVNKCVTQLARYHFIKTEVVQETRYINRYGRKTPYQANVRVVWI